MICPLRTFAGTAPRWPRHSHEQDERGRKFDSTDQASSLASFSLLSFSPSLLQPLMRLGFHAELVSSELLGGTGGHGAGPGRTRCPSRPPECERPFQDPSGWLGIHLPEGEPKAGPPLTSALPEPSQERTVQNTMGNASVKQSENSENCHASPGKPRQSFRTRHLAPVSRALERQRGWAPAPQPPAPSISEFSARFLHPKLPSVAERRAPGRQRADLSGRP